MSDQLSSSEPLYFADGLTVRKRPVHTPDGKGGANITLGFPVCTVSDWLGEDGAITLAEMLCLAEKPA
jgi:hypothetical protein